MNHNCGAIHEGVLISLPTHPQRAISLFKSRVGRQIWLVALPTYIKAAKDGVYLAVKLQPRASKNEIGAPLGDELKISVTSPPVDSAANQALIDLLADILNCSRGAVQIVRGQTSRHKTVFICNLTADSVASRLSR